MGASIKHKVTEWKQADIRAHREWFMQCKGKILKNEGIGIQGECASEGTQDPTVRAHGLA